MKKITIFLLAVLAISAAVSAQSVEDARKMLYYDRFTGAEKILQDVLAKHPDDADATYWLGQVYLRSDSLKKASALYSTARQKGVNSPLLTVGVGHILLLNDKKDSAKALFEEAIQNSKKRKNENPDILNAIGRANADGSTDKGDPAYAIEKLTRAAELNPKDPEIFINQGINYLKLGTDRGGDAYGAFEQALKIDPNYALAKYRLGKIFLSQNNKERFEAYFLGATESDPAFAPAYLELYNYYSLRDVNKAKDYLEKYMANSDKDCKVDFFYADYLFRAGKYQESIDKAKSMEAGACGANPRLKVLYAYNFDRLGDSTKAQQNIEDFLTSVPADKILPDDYLLGASILKRIQGKEESAIKYLQVALNADTVAASRVMYMDTIAGLYRKLGNHAERVVWLQKSYQTNRAPSDFDVYNVADAALSAGQLTLADSMFNVYRSKNPEQIYGYLGLAKTAIATDKDTTLGSAVPAVQTYIDFLRKTDSVKYKSLIIQNYGYLVYVHANVQKDYKAALADLNGILSIDPENSYAKSTAKQIEKILTPARPATSPAAKKSAATKGTGS